MILGPPSLLILMKRLNLVITPALYQYPGGPEAQIGDSIKLFLDTSANPAFPDFVTGTIVTPLVKVSCGQKTSYLIEYDETDLLGAAAYLRPYDVVDVQVLSPVALLQSQFAALIATMAGGFNYDPVINTPAGGAANDLDSLQTVDIPVGRIQLVNGSLYRLDAGVSAEDSPLVIRPDDFNSVTNQKVWFLVDFAANILSAQEISTSALFLSSIPGNAAQFLTTNFTDDRQIEVGDANGTLSPLRDFVDQTAANAVVAIGDTWWDTTLKKARTRLS